MVTVTCTPQLQRSFERYCLSFVWGCCRVKCRLAARQRYL